MTWVTSRPNGSMPVACSQRRRPWRGVHRAPPSRPKPRRVRPRARPGWAHGGRGRQGGMRSDAGLDAGLFVGRRHELVRSQRLPFPTARIQIENPSRFGVKSGSRGKIQLRCCQGRMASSCSQRHTVRVADAGHDAAALGFAHDVGATETRQRQATGRGEFTGEGLDLHDQFWGGSRGRPGRGCSSSPGRRS